MINGFKSVFLILLWSTAFVSCNSGTVQKDESQEKTIEPEKTSESDFDKKIKNNPIVLVDFSATWCMPCKKQAIILEPFIKNETGKVFLIKVDADSNRNLAAKMQVSVLPTLFLFKNGKQVWRGEGLTPADSIKSVINRN